MYPESNPLKRELHRPITSPGMKYSTPYVIPELPPAELLLELDVAARALDELAARRSQLTLGIDGHTRGLCIELDDGDAARRLSPTQLFDLLACG